MLIQTKVECFEEAPCVGLFPRIDLLLCENYQKETLDRLVLCIQLLQRNGSLKVFVTEGGGRGGLFYLNQSALRIAKGILKELFNWHFPRVQKTSIETGYGRFTLR